MNTTPLITIAVVDDHKYVREEISNMLLLMGFHVTIKAANGKDFLEQLSKDESLPDLCLLDLNMPVMDGIETAKAVKLQWPGMKILGYTFNSQEMTKMIESGADACILKCGDAMELKRTLLELYKSSSIQNS